MPLFAVVEIREGDVRRLGRLAVAGPSGGLLPHMASNPHSFLAMAGNPHFGRTEGIEVNPVVRSAKQWADSSDALVAQVKESPYLSVLVVDELAVRRVTTEEPSGWANT